MGGPVTSENHHLKPRPHHQTRKRYLMTRNDVRNAVLFPVAALFLASCGVSGATRTTSTTLDTLDPSTTTTTTTVPIEPCALAATWLSERPISGLPDPVARARTAVIDAALACDYQRLGGLAAASEHGFTYSFGEDGDPAEYWEKAGRDDDRILEDLVRILNMTPAEKETQFTTDVYTPIHVWPAAFGEDPSQEDWDEVSQMYTGEEIAEMIEFGGYIGWRTGFTEDGQWIFFVSGD
jgi:hypothetical protein